MKQLLGKKTDGWNKGFQCMMAAGVYRNQLGSMPINSVSREVPITSPIADLEGCLKACEMNHGLNPLGKQMGIKTGKVGCC